MSCKLFTSMEHTHPHHEKRIIKVVLTGGPCGGKTSALDHLAKYLKSKNWNCLCVPEVPTILMQGGCKYPGEAHPKELLGFETHLLKLQMNLETAFLDIARVNEGDYKGTVVFFDRGCLDPKAYVTQEIWHTILQHSHWTEKQLLDRYDMVLHLVTAANGAEKFYTTANNSARSETPEQAVALDNRVAACWKGHSNHQVIANKTNNFADKLQECVVALEKLLH